MEGKLLDAEAAAEAMQTLLLDGLAGMTLCQALGSLAFGMYGSQEMVVICDELVRIVKRILNGFEANDETLVLDVIRKCGFNGSYMAQEHTRRNYRKEMYFPSLFQRQTIDDWLRAGSKIFTRWPMPGFRACWRRLGRSSSQPALMPSSSAP